MTRRVLALGALAALTLSLSGCGDSTPPAKPIPPIEGFYIDPSLFDATSGTFKGLYVISDRQADELTEKLHFVGSDDGTKFWNVHGEWTDKETGKFVAYFSHRNYADPDLHGVLSEEGIAWNATASVRAQLGVADSPKSWSPMASPSFGLKAQPFTDPSTVGGLYVEKTIYKSGQDSFAGVRLIGANYFPHITFVGTDDGKEFWTVIGKWDKTPGQFRADFTPIRPGDMNTTGKVDHDAILWGDGQWWSKEALTSVAPTPGTTAAPPTSIAV
jgi:hypothetical protein